MSESEKEDIISSVADDEDVTKEIVVEKTESEIFREKLEKHILNSIPEKGHSRLHLAPRFGKTKLIISLIKRDNPKTILWVTPSKKLAKEDIPIEFKKWDAEDYLEKITISTWASLKNITGEFDLIVLDEEQFATEKNCETILGNELKGRIVSMTGTPSTREDKDEIYWRIGLMNICYSITIDEAISLDIISDYEITIYSVKMSQEKDIEAGNPSNRFMTSEASMYKYLDKKARESYGFNNRDENDSIPWAIGARMRAIKESKTKQGLAKSLLRDFCHGRTLVFCPYTKVADDICENSYHSKSESKESLEKFQNFEVDRLSLVNTGGVGFTFEDVEHLMIMQMDSNKTGMSTQKIARSLLKQDGKKKVKIYILCLLGTQDVEWVNNGLCEFDQEKISVTNVTLEEKPPTFDNQFDEEIPF